jgi:hypothetical protein
MRWTVHVAALFQFAVARLVFGHQLARQFRQAFGRKRVHDDAMGQFDFDLRLAALPAGVEP